MRHLVLLSLFSSAALACGVSSVNPLDVDLSGSYELTATVVVRQPGPNPTPLPLPDSSSPSNGKRFRLDLRRNAATYDAVVTPEWGNPAAMSVAVSDGTLVLTGEAQVYGGGVSVGLQDRWTSIVVPVGPGGLGANVSLAGDEMVSQGDIGWMVDIRASASVVRDTEAPDFKVSSSGSAAGKYLPWDRLRVAASEPVRPTKFQTSVHASVKTANAVFATKNNGDKGTDWAGHVLLEGGFDDFDAPGGLGLVTIDPGIPDLVGNIGAPAMQPQTSAFEVVELGAPQVQIDFDGKDGFAPALWGDSEIVKGSECEANVGCARLATSQKTYCASSADGLAARLTGAGAKKLAFRYRVRVDAKYGGGAAMFENHSFLNVELARSGAALAKASVATPKLTDVGTTEMASFESGWVDASVALPPGGANLGFALRPAPMYPYGCGTRGPAPAPIDVTVWVDSLRME